MLLQTFEAQLSGRTISTHTLPKAEFNFPIKTNFVNFSAMMRFWLSFPNPLSLTAFKYVTPLTPSLLFFCPGSLSLIYWFHSGLYFFWCDSGRLQKWLQFFPSQYLPPPLACDSEALHVRGKVYFPISLIWVAVWLALANRMRWKWQCASSEGGLQEVLYITVCSLRHLLSVRVKKPELACWSKRGHVEQRWTVPNKAIPDQPAPQLTWQLSTRAQESPAQTRTTQLSPAHVADR